MIVALKRGDAAMISGRFRGGGRYAAAPFQGATGEAAEKGAAAPRSPPVSATDYQSRSDCTRPETVMGWIREGVAPSRLEVPGVLPPGDFFNL